MPALGVKTATLHRWAKYGYIHLGRPGTGKAVVLTGEEILYAATLNLISVSGGLIKWQLKGLRDCVHVYAQAFWSCLPDEKPESRYCIFKFIGEPLISHAGVALDAEWENSITPVGDAHHIVEGNGSKAAPFFSCIDLEELLRGLVLKIDGRVV